MARSGYRILIRPSWICIQCRTNSSVTSRSTSHVLRTSKKNKSGLPNEPARTRFAPSPTGYLHLGSLRTALFNYLLAKRTGGQFLLRIEDTDQKRTVAGAEERLYEDLRWAGLQWDEGPNVGGPYGPYRQSERTAIYRSHADNLIASGHAYCCFCSAERLDAMARHRNEAGLPLGYDRHCIDISPEKSGDRAVKGEAHVVRLKADGYPMFQDLVYGTTGQNRTGGKKQLDFIDRVYEDPILLKSDGHPTYHLANVVDDHNMKITHVIRGTEWMASTPMHVALYNAFNWSPPQFGHVPLLVDRNGQKLSKRNADIDISSFRDDGVLPATLINFAALLGWSHSQRSDVFSLQQLESIFNLKITKGNTIVAFDKLWFLQKAHAQRFAVEGAPEFEDLVRKISEAAATKWTKEQLVWETGLPVRSAVLKPHAGWLVVGWVTTSESQLLDTVLQGRSLAAFITPLLRADAKSYTTPAEFLARNQTFFTKSLGRPPYKPIVPGDQATGPVPLGVLHTAAAALSLVPESHWNIETHRFNISSYSSAGAFGDTPPPSSPPPPGGTEDVVKVAEDKLFKRELYHYLRWALSAGAPGPGIPETLEILGRAESVRRLKEACRLTTPMQTDTGRRRPKGPSLRGPDDNTWMGSLAPR